tara:strand:+ start:2097 stop:2774 length:678 start_codon:yes stop_codon:yes gene_type:complete
VADEYVISVVLEGNASSLSNATDKGTQGQKNLEKSTTATNVALLTQLARYQAMTAALNQTIGGINKIATGMEAAGFETQAEFIRKNVKFLEGMAGVLELVVVGMTLYTLRQASAAVATTASTAANTGFIASLYGVGAGFTAALGPIGIFLVVLGALIGLAVLLETRLQLGTKIIEGLTSPLEKLQDLINGILDSAGAAPQVLNPLSEALELIVSPVGFLLDKAGV